MLSKIIILGMAIYFTGVVAFLALHIACLPMVTFPLALLRSLVWPIFWATGWPHGTPMTMD